MLDYWNVRKHLMRLLFLAILTVVACASPFDKPKYCDRPFSFDDPRFDLDHDGYVLGSDFTIYVDKCD